MRKSARSKGTFVPPLLRAGFRIDTVRASVSDLSFDQVRYLARLKSLTLTRTAQEVLVKTTEDTEDTEILRR